jgi:hypothetical protein
MMLGGPALWSLKKQVTVALSTVEAEYIVLTHSTKQAVWMYSFLGELAMPQEKPAVLHCDNMGATSLAKDAKGHTCIKHIDIHEHYICEHIADGDIEICRVESANNLVDLFTKILPRDTHLSLVCALSLTARRVDEGGAEMPIYSRCVFTIHFLSFFLSPYLLVYYGHPCQGEC